MSGPLEVVLHRVPVGSLPPDPPTLAVDPVDSPAPVAERLAAGHRRADGPLSVLVRAAVVATPDTAEVTGVEVRGRTYAVRVRVQRFAGIVGANVVSHLVVELRTGPLPPDGYAAQVTVEPEDARTRAEFTVGPGESA
jgi:hypothetical protein